MDFQELRTVQWVTIAGSIASVVSVLAGWNSTARVPLLIAAVVLPLCTAAIELQKRRLSVFFSGIRKYHASFQTQQNGSVFNSVREEYLYMGITFASVLSSFREWYGSQERRANVRIRLLLTDPKAEDVLRFQAQYETGIWTPEAELTLQQRATLDGIVDRARNSIASVMQTLATLPNADTAIEVYFHGERLRKWMHVVDGKLAYVGVLPIGQDGYRAPVIELQRQANHWRLFDAYREEWESVFQTAQRASLGKAADA